ncbi:MAG: branched-chain amino acid ABC transporter ATP-binding protein/permease [Arenicellales bacterium]
MSRRWLPEAAIVLVLVAAPFAGPYIRASADTLTRTLVWGIFGLGFDILFGYTGLLSFGQAAFYGTGGFVCAYLLVSGTISNVFVGLVVATLAATLYGVLVGFFCLRRVGIYLAMITLAFGEMSFFLENSVLTEWTGGENGLPGVPPPQLSVAGHVFQISSGWPMYAFIALVFFVGFVLARRIVRSPFGMVLRAIKSNPERTPAVGHAVSLYKLSVFALAAAYAGLGGGLLGVFQGYMPPDAFDLSTSGQLVLSTVIGGAGTLVGPLIGSFIWFYLRDALQHFAVLGALWKLIFGAVFVACVTVFRLGIAGEIRRHIAQRRKVAAVPVVTTEPATRVTGEAEPVSDPGGPERAGAVQPPRGEVVFEASDLSKHYGGIEAVSNVSLEVGERELLAVIGPNGAGKTTLLNMLAGQIPPSEGEIRFQGRRITKLGITAVCQLGIAKTYQINQLFAGFTVRQNVEVAALAQRRGAFRFDCLRRFEADTALRDAVDGVLATVNLTAHADRPTAELAYGEKRRLEIAIALASEPRLLLMDEPLAGMSPPERADAVVLIRELARRHAVILVEHDMDAVFRLAERIVVMHNGRKLVEGTPEKIQSNSEVQEAYLGGVEDHELA